MTRPYRTVEDDRDVFRALAHPVRRQIVTAAIDEARSFDHLQQLTHRSPTALAAHLRVLREAKLIAATRSGHSVFYRASRRGLRGSAQWLSALVTAPAAG